MEVSMEVVYKVISDNEEQLELEATLYKNNSIDSKGIILYFHGGGLVMGSRKDLPRYHIERLTSSGYPILSFDYRLAPEANFDQILSDVLDGIEYFINNKEKLGFKDLPYFLWGRSAGAYLALLAFSKGLSLKPQGIISFYGYGFTVDSWYNKPSQFYLKYPKLDEKNIRFSVENTYISSAIIQKRFPLYLYSRQSGKWLDIITGGKEEEFLKKHSFLNLPAKINFPPTLLVHATGDGDVPYEESQNLSSIIKNSSLLTFHLDEHDFDRNEDSLCTEDLLNRTIEFLDSTY